jgi:hypothetical protein
MKLHIIHLATVASSLISWQMLCYESIIYIALEYKSFRYFLTQCFRSVLSHRFLGAFAKLRKATVSFVICVMPHVATRLPLNGLLLNFIFECFPKIC